MSEKSIKKWRDYHDNVGNVIKLNDKNIELLKLVREIKNKLYQNDIGELSDLELNLELTIIRHQIKNL